MKQAVIAFSSAIALCLATTAPLHAQLPAGSVRDSAAAASLGLTPGVRIRYGSRLDPGRLHTRQLLRAGNDTLWLSGGRTVAVKDLAPLQVSGGVHSLPTRVGRGALWGGLIGGLLGALPDASPDAIAGPQSRVEGAALGAVVGVTIGAIGGGLFAGEKWRTVRVTESGGEAAEGLR